MLDISEEQEDQFNQYMKKRGLRINKEIMGMIDRNHCKKFFIEMQVDVYNIRYMLLVRNNLNELEAMVINDPPFDTMNSIWQYIEEHYTVLYRKDRRAIFMGRSEGLVNG